MRTTPSSDASILGVIDYNKFRHIAENAKIGAKSEYHTIENKETIITVRQMDLLSVDDKVK